MKIAVYAIAKNEEQFVLRWWQSAMEADYILIADTGSTDGTVQIARNLGINVIDISIQPWRFDDARNAALAVIPGDIDMCIALDMDEVLVDGWRKELEVVSADTTRARYKYVWSWNPDGSEGLTYGGDKIHSRYGYRWKHPVHETLVPTQAEHQEWCAMQIHHHPDSTKSRSQYFPLLEVAVSEDPYNDRNQFYLAREYFYGGRHADAVPHFNKHLELSNWPPERAASRRYLAKCDPDNKLHHLLGAIQEDSARRESWVELAQHYHDTQDWTACLDAAEHALEIVDKPLDYLCEAFAWGPLALDLASVSSFWLGKTDAAVVYAQQALEIDPTDIRIAENLRVMTAIK